MASPPTRKQCASNDGCKQAAVSNCEGCSKAFCIKHMIDHRRILDEEMNIIIDEHDRLKNTLNQQATKPEIHPLVNEIDEWEKESIVTIQQRAKELREDLRRSAATFTNEPSSKLQQSFEQLKLGRENDDFIETDLQRWMKMLNELKTERISPPTIFINRNDNVALVQNITLILTKTNEFFERFSNNKVRLEENGQVAIHDASENLTEVRGRNEYKSEYHEIHLTVEQSSGNWMFFGINSKTVPLKYNSHCYQSAYGWSSNDNIWCNGNYEKNTLSSCIEMKTNDVITLIFDCDNHKISMINERTTTRHEITVNANYCPFPWQLHVNLYEANSRVRILTS